MQETLTFNQFRVAQISLEFIGLDMIGNRSSLAAASFSFQRVLQLI
jgi:hypothetical protein